ncbi:MAG: cbb3-type cytochrome oxidase assembly protein CcoS [Candidatus Competibacteraceae bacterium]
MAWALVWAVKTGQFDDLEGPAHRILMDDDDPRISAPQSFREARQVFEKTRLIKWLPPVGVWREVPCLRFKTSLC